MRHKLFTLWGIKKRRVLMEWMVPVVLVLSVLVLLLMLDVFGRIEDFLFE